MADWDRSDPAVVRGKPSDNEMQASQGPIPMHSLEHLASSDRGVVKMRRQYQRELAKMAKGEPLINVTYDPAQEVFEQLAGSTLVKAAPVIPDIVSTDGTLSNISVWSVVMKTPMGEDKVTFNLQIAAGKVSGTIVNDRETCEVVDGVADGTTLRWISKLTKPMSMKLTFTAKIEGESISGGAKSFFGTANFTGKRA